MKQKCKPHGFDLDQLLVSYGNLWFQKKMVYDFCNTWLYHSGNQPGNNGSCHCNKLRWELDSIRSRYCISDFH